MIKKTKLLSREAMSLVVDWVRQDVIDLDDRLEELEDKVGDLTRQVNALNKCLNQPEPTHPGRCGCVEPTKPNWLQTAWTNFKNG